MEGDKPLPLLHPLHADSLLVASKLRLMEQSTTEALIQSLMPGQRDCLNTRADGTILDGHHRIFILRKRGVYVDKLPREVVEKEAE